MVEAEKVKHQKGGQTESSKHTFHQEENDKDLADVVPINADSLDLFKTIGDGILLCKLINCAYPGTIDTRALNENLNLAIESAKNIGCVMVNVNKNNLLQGTEHIILGVLWQIIRIHVLSNMDLKHCPYLIRLKEENEELADLQKLPKEQLLLRWFNYHLKAAGDTYSYNFLGSEKRVHNFDKDLMDGENYVTLLHQIAPSQCDTSGLSLEGDKRAAKIITDARKLGVPPCIKPVDITSGSEHRLNLLHCAHIFNVCSGLAPELTEEEKIASAGLLDDDTDQEASREERVFRMWVNSMGLEGVYINNLIQDVRDGVVLGQILNKLKPGCIGPKDISSKTNMRIQRIQNANKVMEVSTKELHCKAVGIGGVDIVDGNKKLILAIVWQLMRVDVNENVGGVKEDDLVKWANSLIDEQYRVTSLKDKKIATGQFFFRLLASFEPQLINWDFVTPGQSEDDIMNNAKYVLSVARKLGCSVFLVWEHIRDVNPKFLLTLVAAIKTTGENYSASKSFKNSVKSGESESVVQ